MTLSEIAQMRPRFRGGPAFSLGPPSATFPAGVSAQIVGGSTVASGATLTAGSNVRFTSATPAPAVGYHVAVWFVDGKSTNAGNIIPNAAPLPFVFNDIQSPIEVELRWLRIGAVSSNGLGASVTSMDVTHLARTVIGHQGFSVIDNRIGNLAGFDRAPLMSDVTQLAQWLVGFNTNTLRAQTLPN
jgi:hypothetical protein